MSNENLFLPVSGYIWLGLIALIVVLEIVLYFATSPSESLSGVLRGWSVVGLAAPFGWGVLAGHFFYPSFGARWTGFWYLIHEGMPAAVVLLMSVLPIVALAVLDLTLALKSTPETFSEWVGLSSSGFLSFAMLTLGFIWGALSWPA